jgi:hypothetical protein
MTTTKKLGILLVSAIVVPSAPAAILFQDTFNQSVGTDGINDNLLARQAGGTTSSTYSDAGAPASNINANVLRITGTGGADGVTTVTNFYANLNATSFEMSADIQGDSGGASSFLYILSESANTAVNSPFNVSIADGAGAGAGFVDVRSGTAGSATINRYDEATLQGIAGLESFDITMSNLYTLRAIGGLNSGTMSFFINGVNVSNTAPTNGGGAAFDTSIDFGDADATYQIRVQRDEATFDNITLDVIPEPSSVALLGLASVGLVVRRRR